MVQLLRFLAEEERTMKVASIATLIVSSMLACTSAALRMPGQIRALPDPVETRAAILEGIEQRRWIFADEVPGGILARIDVRSHVAEVWVEYDEDAITFRYAGSHRLDCDPSPDGCESIHNNYNRWVRNLSIAIATAVAKRRPAAS
jgi:hypothetical protein